ncbi:MAG: hypothetical protein AAGF78_15275 [Pseudomonadota bacterium]
MIPTALRRAALGLCVTAAPLGAAAHQLVVFASVEDCTDVVVEAKFSNGNVAQKGEVRVLGEDRDVLSTLMLEENGTARVGLDSIDHSAGLLIEVDTGGHDNYWILTPDDIAGKCGS